MGIAPRMSLQSLFTEEVAGRPALQSWGLNGWTGEESSPESTFLHQFLPGPLERSPSLHPSVDPMWQLECGFWSEHTASPTLPISFTSSVPSDSLKTKTEPGHSLIPDPFHPISRPPLFSRLQRLGLLKVLLLSYQRTFWYEIPFTQKPLPVTFTFTYSQAGYPNSFFISQGSLPN